MDIEHLGEQTVALLVQTGHVRDVADLYALGEDELASLPGFKQRAVANLLGAIAASRDRPLERLLVGLSIRHVGVHVARIIARRLQTLEAVATIDRDDLAAIEGVGPVIATSVVDWFANPVNRALVERLTAAGVGRFHAAEPETVELLPQVLAGVTVVLSGTLSGLTREEAARAIEARGGKVGSTVSKRTNVVVLGASPGTKAQRAAALGIPTVDEQGLHRMLAEGLNSANTEAP